MTHLYEGCCCVVRYLQPPVQCPLDGHTFARLDAVCGDGSDERVQLVLPLLQFLYQTLNGPLGKALVLCTLSMTHQAVHNTEAGVSAAAGGGAEHRHAHLTRN